MKRMYVNVDSPLKDGEVRTGLLSKGKGALVFDETQEQPWLRSGKKGHQLKKFPHGIARRMDDGEVRIRLRVMPTETDLDMIEFGGEMGDIAEYICRYMERRK